MEVKIDSSWKKHLAGEFEKSYFTELTAFVKKEYQEGKVYPHPKNIFRSLPLFSYSFSSVTFLTSCLFLKQ